MAKKKVKKIPVAMHKMPNGQMMKDSEMKAMMKKEDMHDEEMMGKYESRVKKGKYRR